MNSKNKIIAIVDLQMKTTTSRFVDRIRFKKTQTNLDFSEFN